MKPLKDMLGRWKYTHGTSDKYYQIIPEPVGLDTYQLSWGFNKDLREAGRAINIPAEEALRRIRDKERGGYTLKPEDKYLGLVPPSGDLVIAGKRKNIMPDRKKKIQSKAVPAPKGFSLMDWVKNEE